MPSTSRSTTPVGIELDSSRVDTPNSMTTRSRSRPSPRTSIPRRTSAACRGDACTCQHLGYVTAGQITFRWAEREETYVEGDAYVAGPGHTTAWSLPGRASWSSPHRRLEPVMAAIGRNLEAMAGAAS